MYWVSHQPHVTSSINLLTGRTSSIVKNFKHFAELMISFDVKSLFTNVPIDEALEVVHKGMTTLLSSFLGTLPKLATMFT